MAGSVPFSKGYRGYKGIVPKAVFKLLNLAIKLFIQNKQIFCKVIVQKQLLVVVN